MGTDPANWDGRGPKGEKTENKSAPNSHAAEGKQSVRSQFDNIEGRGARRVVHPRSVKRQDPKGEPNKHPTEREPKRHLNTINRKHLRNCNPHCRRRSRRGILRVPDSLPTSLSPKESRES